MQALSSMRAALENIPYRVRIITLGLLSWALCAGLPWLYGPESTQAFDLIALFSGPVLLGFGSVLSQREHASAPFILLAAFPVSLSVGVSRIDHDQALATFAPSTLVLALLSLAAYGASALQASHETTRLRSVEHKPLGEVAQVAPSLRRRNGASLALLTVTLGALLALAFGSSATPAHYREQWGQAARAGAVVAALGAGIVGCIALAILAPGLRAERAEPRSAQDQAKRLSWLFLVAASGLVVYAFLR